MPIPEYARTCLESTDLPEVNPVEFRADAVVTLRRDNAVMAVIVEVQRSRDAVKRRSWPVYLTTLHARLRCPTVLLVICPDEPVARWCAKPIEVGHPGWVLRPLVLGPKSVPVVDDPKQARRSPGLAVLSVLAHGGDNLAVVDACSAGLDEVDHDRARLYTKYILSQLPEHARKHLEAILKTEIFEYMSEFTQGYVEKGKAEGKAEGIAQGEVKALLTFLDARGVALSDAARERIMSCTDSDQLNKWVRLAATVTHVDELFD